MAISITYHLAGTGWAECEVASEDKNCKLTASYLGDALGSMVIAAIAVLKGFPAVSFRFEEEPGEFRWSIREEDGEHFRLRIFWFDQSYLHRPDDAGKELISLRSNPVEFGAAVYDAAKRVLDEHGQAGYLGKWVESPFPVHLMELLREQMKRWGHEV